MHAVDANNAHIDGDAFSADALSSPTRVGNHCQIGRKDFSVTRRTRKLRKTGQTDSLLRQVVRMGRALREKGEHGAAIAILFIGWLVTRLITAIARKAMGRSKVGSLANSRVLATERPSMISPTTPTTISRPWIGPVAAKATREPKQRWRLWKWPRCSSS